MSKKGEKNTCCLLGKGDKEKHKEKAAQKNERIKEKQEHLKSECYSFKEIDFLGSYVLLVFYTKSAIQTSPSY